MSSASQHWRGDASGFGDLPAPPATIAPEPIAANAPRSDPESEATLRRFIDDEVLPFLEARRTKRYRLNSSRHLQETFALLRLRVATSYVARVDEIQSWCEERRLMDVQTRMQHWLHAWLFVHAPVSFLLVIVTFWHAYVTLFYY